MVLELPLPPNYRTLQSSIEPGNSPSPDSTSSSVAPPSSQSGINSDGVVDIQPVLTEAGGVKPLPNCNIVSRSWGKSMIKEKNAKVNPTTVLGEIYRTTSSLETGSSIDPNYFLQLNNLHQRQLLSYEVELVSHGPVHSTTWICSLTITLATEERSNFTGSGASIRRAKDRASREALAWLTSML